MEHGAESMQSYGNTIMNGLLQTEEHTRAVIESAAPNIRLAETDRRVQARMIRQRRITGDDPLHLSTAISEAVLHQQIGGARCLKAQLEHVARLIESHPDTLEVRVVPFSSTGHAAVGGSSFLLSDFPSGRLPTMLWHETATSTKLTSTHLAVREHGIAPAGATSSAFSREDSLAMIKAASGDL
ncbi:DUF5753 domain-containing protein [Saccharopolyspora sp. NFXS83]|uniref:DUF5753 domain-containing protein n=1 Tax=Saccharopolyspora sp. NFXS83 TaxID=2993560 RepID=UPI00224B5B67|nr:DUF5753 domain-containing protein [Saccharopolyspora sp. NFXS83]MCX2731203.1 DUF5753 domain-containing protein [Saccharopolyspora sp. NFXS83]